MSRPFCDGSSFVAVSRKKNFSAAKLIALLKVEINLILQSKMNNYVPLNLAFPVEIQA
jgi:hypothetical protein